MQRTLVLISILGLVAASLAIGALAAHWPFWSRALAWQLAADGWPQDLPGRWQSLDAGDGAPTLPMVEDPALAAQAAATAGHVLLVTSGDEPVRSYFAPGFTPGSRIDGRELAQLLPVLVFGSLAGEVAAPLDTGLGQWFEEWRGEPRGEITPRQLMWQLSGLAAGPVHFLNPFGAQAMLRSGPDFRRAALAAPLRFPPGTHFEPAAVNAQLLSLVIESIAGRSYADVLESLIWRQVASRPARAMLDRRSGLAAHCCMSATPEDWLRLAQVLANGGSVAGRPVLPGPFMTEMMRESPIHPGQGLGVVLDRSGSGDIRLVFQSHGRLLAAMPGTGRALFWAGAGALAPERLQQLLAELEPPG